MLLRSLQLHHRVAAVRLVHASRVVFCSATDSTAAAVLDGSVVAGAKPKPSKPGQVAAPPVTTWHTLVIGEIVAFTPHPTADRLNVCQVDVGDRENLLQIVCGAPNVRQGARVPVATVGTRLALQDPASGDVKVVKIKKSKLRGEVSQGMICSEAELGLADVSDGILILEDDAPVGSLVQHWQSIARRLAVSAPSQSSSADVSSSSKNTEM